MEELCVGISLQLESTLGWGAPMGIISPHTVTIPSRIQETGFPLRPGAFDRAMPIATTAIYSGPRTCRAFSAPCALYSGMVAASAPLQLHLHEEVLLLPTSYPP